MQQRESSRRWSRRAIDNRIGLSLWFRIARVYGRNLRTASQHLRAWNLTAAQFDVLAQVGASGPMPQLDLARRLLVTQGNMTQVLVRMEQRGLLERRREGRLKQVTLTDEGRRLYAAVVPEQEQLQSEQFRMLTEAEKRQLLALLRKVERAHSPH